MTKMTNSPIDRQIFIGGCSRSGTTLLGAMLGAHSECICPPESHFKISVLGACGWDKDAVDVQTALSLIQRHWRFKIWELDIDPTELPEKALGTSYPRLLGWIVARYAEGLGKSGANIWVDHTPANIGDAPTLLELFPRSKMIHIVRDGRAVAGSIMGLDWGPNTIIKAARWWLDAVAYGLALETLLKEQEEKEDQITRVRYEDLVTTPEETLGRLCDHLGIDYQPQMAKAGGFKPPRYTASQHTLIGKEPDAGRATRWETQLTVRQIEIFESLAHDFLNYLGYPLRYGLRARPPNVAERVIAGATEIYREQITNRIRWLVRSYPLWLSRDFLRERT
jgi:hypothetical protein